MRETWTIRGRAIGAKEITEIKAVIEQFFCKGRKEISRQICHLWKWYQDCGKTKDRACRDVLLFLESKGVIELPPRRHNGNNEKRITRAIELPNKPKSGKVKDHSDIWLELITSAKDSLFWNRVIEGYHYQGHQVIVGKYLKYFIWIGQDLAGCIGWGSAAWSIKPRDHWIGWDKAAKDKNLSPIINNIRFLILPWIKVKYLASYILGLSIRQVPRDWEKRYGHAVYLLETFVEKERFQGTCYKAGNWIYLGDTKGSAKRGNNHRYHGNIKSIFVYPLYKNFRELLQRRS